MIAFNLSGHGNFDLSSFDSYIRGELVDFEYPEEKVRKEMTHLPEVSLD